MWIQETPGGRIVAVNRAAMECYGFSRAEFLALTAAEIELGEDSAGIVRHRTRAGHVIDVRVSARAFDYHMQPALLVMITDVTEQRAMAERLRQAQRMEAVGLLASGIAHDFNNLLTIINGYAQLIAGRSRKQDPQRELAQEIVKAGERGANLARELLAYSMRPQRNPVALNVDAAIESAREALRGAVGSRVELNLRLTAGTACVLMDERQLQQALLNLAAAARAAMPGGGTIDIGTSLTEDALVLTVRDSGAGIDEKTRRHLLRKTLPAGSTSRLELQTALSILERAGAQVEIASSPSRGTAVQVTMRRAAATTAADTLEAHRRSVHTVLVVEDDEMVRALVCEILGSRGYAVLQASDPAEARQLAGSHRGPIDLLVTDVVMPKRNGRELAEEILNLRPGIQVVYMSGYAAAAIEYAGIQEQGVHLLHKPFTPKALVDCVANALAGQSRAHSAGD